MINEKKKFDAIVINPPYATTGGHTIHLDFTEAALQMSDKVVSLFPFNLVYQNNDFLRSYKDAFSKRLISVEEVSSDVFEGTDMSNVGIWDFEKNDETIQVIDIDKNVKIVSSLFEVESFKSNESEIFEYLESVESVSVVSSLGRLNREGRDNYKKYLVSLSSNEQDALIRSWVVDSLKSKCELTDRYVLVVSSANGQMNGKVISSCSGQICSNVEDLVDTLSVHPTTRGYNGLLFDSQKSAENCREALERSLMRFVIYRTQTGRLLSSSVFRYVPSIDWSKVDNDVDILVQCGCSVDKAKRFVKYAEAVITKIDNEKRSKLCAKI